MGASAKASEDLKKLTDGGKHGSQPTAMA